MIACLPVTREGTISSGWGRAERVAVVTMVDQKITGWRVLDVGWHVLHDQDSEGAHHARIARFLRDHAVDVVITGRMGAGMERMLESMGIRVVQQVEGEARAAVLAVGADRAIGLS
jgi:predicted Fe-Mo cluster-binding NifX family protein